MSETPLERAHRVRLREAWVERCRMAARLNADLAGEIVEHDEACATSMEFVALRLEKVADRVAGEGHPGQPRVPSELDREWHRRRDV